MTRLQPGERLPSIRSLAENLQVNKLTVVEAYGVLEADGLIHARQGAGYFVNKLTIPKGCDRARTSKSATHELPSAHTRGQRVLVRVLQR